MKIADIVNQLKAVLPKHTDDFTTNLSITSLTRSGSTVTATTSSAHGLVVGKKALITGAKTPILIDSLTQVNGVAIALTNTKHLLYKGIKTVEIDGADQTEYNGIKNIVEAPTLDIESITIAGNVATVTTIKDHGYIVNSNFKVRISGAQQEVYNRDTTIIATPTSKTFTYTVEGTTEDAVNKFGQLLQVKQLENAYTINFEVDSSATSPATGTIYQLSTFQDGYNGYKIVTTIPSATSFTYEITQTPLSPAQGTIITKIKPTISGSISLDLATEYYQSKFENGQATNWMFVVMEDEVTSRNDKVRTDAITYANPGYGTREQDIQTFNLYIFILSSNELLHVNSRDKAESYKKAINKALLRFQAPSVLNDNLYSGITGTNNGAEAFNSSYYVHRFTFEATNYYTTCDGVDDADISAFRIFDFDFKDDDGNVIATMDGELDQEA
jgi:hypothetical protein